MKTLISRMCQLTLAACFLSLAGCGSGGTGTGTIIGRIVDDLGKPVGGATVTVGAVTATTATDGSYTLGPVSAGAHSVAATLNGFAFPDQAVTVVAGKSTTVNVTGSRANHAPRLTLAATPGQVAFVGGFVTFDVTATDDDSDALTLNLTSALGKVTLTNLGSGAYRGQLSLPANSTFVDHPYTFVLTGTDGRVTTTVQTSASVKGLTAPGGVGGGTDVGGGGPPVPGI